MKKLLPLAAGGFALCVIASAAVVLGSMRSSLTDSWAYQKGLERAQGDEQVRAALGAPIKAGWWLTGKLLTRNGKSHAELAIPLEGSARHGLLAVEAHTSATGWELDRLEVKLDGAPSLDLLDEEN